MEYRLCQTALSWPMTLWKSRLWTCRQVHKPFRLKILEQPQRESICRCLDAKETVTGTGKHQPCSAALLNRFQSNTSRLAANAKRVLFVFNGMD